jgi:hypothetical protein
MEREVGLENIMDGFVSIRDENTMKVVVHPNE